MNSFKKLNTIAGWVVFSIAFIVYFMTVERTGSLWDCGEFITGAYKLEVVHPPGAALFMIIGRMFTFVAEILSDNPEDIAFSVNLLSGVCTAFAATFVCWVAGILTKISFVGREVKLEDSRAMVAAGAGLIAGLTTAFATSIWFSAVEGEVYAMSTFFTALVLWAVIKWYNLPDNSDSDRWLVFGVFAAGLSIGVHLLSLLTFPALALFFYFKKYENHSLLGMLGAAVAGVAYIAFIQFFIITGIPKLWSSLELLMVNSFGLPFHTGIYPLILILGAILFFGLRFAHQRQNALLQKFIIASYMVVIGFSTIGVVVIRANANTPINMNNPSDPMRLIPYLNREQYGERALLHGPNFDGEIRGTETEDRYGRLGDQYEIVDQKVSYVFNDRDKILFPRMGDYSEARKAQYKRWMGLDPAKPLPAGRPNMGDNLGFMFNYQLGWMYWRYFFWNFAGRQNGDQGYYSWDKSSGHWLSGIEPLDEVRLYNMDELPESKKKNAARNTYYMLPLIFGILGLIFHFRRRPNDAIGLLALFIITGIGIIIYSNQPPNEPRERDYVLVGSFFTFAIWVGMGAAALFELLRERAKLDGKVAAIGAVGLVLLAPIIMGFQNYDVNDRSGHTGARDYASNFLESCEPNSIIFTYGDNDTYPLWYAQEVEGIRTDVRVVNLSLIAVDWYIDQLRRKVNDSPPIKLSISREAYRGSNRNLVPYRGNNQDRRVSVNEFLKFVGEDHPFQMQGRTIKSYMPTKQVYIPVNKQLFLQNGTVSQADTGKIVSQIPINISGNYMIKDDLAIMDVIASNINDRPIYFAVTCQPSKLMGLQDYTELEGLGLRIIPVKSQSDPQYLIMGSGRVDTDAVYENVMNKFRWGNFDKEELFVDRSYLPSIQSHRIIMLRTARALQAKGEDQKAVDLAKKYLESFPHMNFPYDYNTMYFINILIEGGALDYVKPHMETLAIELADNLAFYESLDPETIETSFRQDYGLAYRTQQDLMRSVNRVNDGELKKKLEDLFAPYQLEGLQGRN
ncbi:MAG: DUF2723 domain-containing protein [Saprospiraceae bacterium]